MKITDFWFEKDIDGNPMLVRADGSRITYHDELDIYLDNRYAYEGLVRSLLYAEANPIRDEKLFASETDTVYGYILKDEYVKQAEVSDLPLAFMVMSPVIFESEVMNRVSSFDGLKELSIDLIHDYQDVFFSSIEAQCKWQRLLLYPVAIEVNREGNLMPIDLTKTSYGDSIRDMCDVVKIKKLSEFITSVKKRFAFTETESVSAPAITEEELMDLAAFVKKMTGKA